VHLRSLTDLEDSTGTVLYDGALSLPDGRLVLGDADSEVIVNNLSKQTRVRVQAQQVSDHGVAEVRTWRRNRRELDRSSRDSQVPYQRQIR
jgi:hypothetical protein